jgi:hypothetical protein
MSVAVGETNGKIVGMISIWELFFIPDHVHRPE